VTEPVLQLVILGTDVNTLHPSNVDSKSVELIVGVSVALIVKASHPAKAPSVDILSGPHSLIVFILLTCPAKLNWNPVIVPVIVTVYVFAVA